jgi:hypothetical protein
MGISIPEPQGSTRQDTSGEGKGVRFIRKMEKPLYIIIAGNGRSFWSESCKAKFRLEKWEVAVDRRRDSFNLSRASGLPEKLFA